MFMHQKQNKTAHLNRDTRTVYPLGSQFKLPCGASSLEQMRLLGHASTKQRCEIQCEALEFSEKHKWLWFKLVYNQTGETLCATRQSEGFSIYTSPSFTMDLL